MSDSSYLREIHEGIEPVLDKGYVRYVRHMGDDLGVVNDLRASFMKESAVWTERDRRLLAMAFRRREFSAWRHHVVTLEVKAPMMVARQLYKYSVGSSQREDQFGWNEASRRYVTLDPEFYVPQEWRLAPLNKKQGSAGVCDPKDNEYYTSELEEYIHEGMQCYNVLINRGVAPEMARGFLPAYFMYTTWHWTMSINALFLVLFERIPHDAQEETRAYAIAIQTIVRPLFPTTMEAVESVLAGAVES